jgi:DNA polymerase-3 subunit delta'
LIIGHDKIWNFLKQSAEKNRLAHAYLFAGPNGLGKKKLAFEFIKFLQCRGTKTRDGFACDSCSDCRQIENSLHPDVLAIGLEGFETREGEKVRKTEIKIEEAELVRHHLSLSPFSGNFKAVIINSAEKLNSEACNYLLKTIEEPSPKSILILISSNWQKILPTILSRCQFIRFSPVKKTQIESGLAELGFSNNREIGKAAKLCCGRPAVAIKIFGDAAFKKTEALGDLKKIFKSNLAERFNYAAKMAKDIPAADEILEQWFIWHRDKIMTTLGLKDLTVFDEEDKSQYTLPGLGKTMKKIDQTRGLLKESGFNSRLILENLLLNLDQPLIEN